MHIMLWKALRKISRIYDLAITYSLFLNTQGCVDHRKKKMNGKK